METKVVKAVAVISEDGFLSKSAPVVKPRAMPAMILLSFDQRSLLTRDRIVTYDDMRYQGKFDGALPQGYEAPRYDRPHHQGWNNADNQWYNAAVLGEYLSRQVAKADHSCIGTGMIVDLVNAAAK
jgi:hypothetical protein